MEQYLVDCIFPTEEVHLICGPTGVGKTTFTFQLLDDWREGKPVLGFPSHPCPFVYVSCDRSKRSVGVTLRRINVRHIDFVDARGIARHGEGAFNAILTQARHLVPDCRLLFIESFHLLVPEAKSGNSYRATAIFLSELSRTLEQENMTVIGTVHSPKQREGDAIIDPRHLIMGTVAWGGFVETIIAILRVKPSNPADMHRRILVLPRNAREQCLDYELDANGRFVKSAEPPSNSNIADVLLDTIPLDEVTTTSALVSLAEQADITARRTIERWITQCIEDGRLIRVGKGLYKRPLKQ